MTKIIDSRKTDILAITDIEVVPFINKYSVNFNGIDQRVLLPTSSYLDIESTDTFSMSVWVKPTDFNVLRSIITKKQAGLVGYGLKIRNVSGKIVFVLQDTLGGLITLDADIPITVAQWNHVAMVYNGSKKAAGLEIYINGVLSPKTVITDTLSGTIKNSDNVYFGMQADAIQFCYGNLDEFSFYDRVLTAIEIGYIYNNNKPRNQSLLKTNSSLVHWYRMGDDDTFPTLIDVVSSNNGTMENMIAANIQEDTP